MKCICWKANFVLNKPLCVQGYYRKGAALSGLQRHSDAMIAYLECLTLDASITAVQTALKKVSLKCPKPYSWLNPVDNSKYSQQNKEPFLNQLAHVILVHNLYSSTSTCFLVYSHEFTFCLLSQVFNKFDTSCTGSELVRFNWYVSSPEKNCDFMVSTCWHTKFVHRIRWIHLQKHVNWASWTREFTYRTWVVVCWRCTKVRPDSEVPNAIPTVTSIEWGDKNRS